MGGVCIFTSGYTYESVRMSIYIYHLCMYYRTRTDELGRGLFLYYTYSLWGFTRWGSNSVFTEQ